MQSQLCFLLFLSFAFFLSGSYQAPSAGPSVTLTANTTSLAVGGTVKLTCTLHNYALDTDTDSVLVDFYQDGDLLGHYTIETTAGKQRVLFFQGSEVANTVYPVALSSSFPVYQITITPTLAGAHAYFCDLNTLKIFAESSHVNITTKAKA